MTVERIIFDTEEDAIEVVKQMREIIRGYGFVTVADYYELAGLIANYADNKYGWAEIPVFSIITDHIGYELRLRPCMPIEHYLKHESKIES